MLRNKVTQLITFAKREYFNDLRGCLYGRWDGTFFIPALKTVYMHGRRDGMFAGTGRFSSRVYMKMFLPGTISPGTICKVNIISSRQSGTECLYNKNCPALAGISVERTGIPLCLDWTKNVLAKLFPYKRNVTNKRYIYMHGEIPFNVPCRQMVPLRYTEDVDVVFTKKNSSLLTLERGQ